MNERIKELKEQAFNFVAEQNMTKKEYFWENIKHDRTLQDRVDKKFAELIVKATCNVILHYDNVDEGVAVAKKQLGVEE